MMHCCCTNDLKIKDKNNVSFTITTTTTTMKVLFFLFYKSFYYFASYSYFLVINRLE